MKKLLTRLLVAATLLSPMTALANSDQIIDGTPERNEGQIPVEINLGFDPTSDNDREPPHPDMWIRVAIPTEVILFSDPAAGHSEFIPVRHTIRNHSVRGVQIDVSTFTPADGTPETAFAPIEELNIVSAHTITVIENGEFTGYTGPLMSLDGNGNETPNPTEDYQMAAFVFNGTINASLLTQAQDVLQTSLTLHLRPINTDGQLYN